jgi:hypothetical protein
MQTEIRIQNIKMARRMIHKPHLRMVRRGNTAYWICVDYKGVSSRVFGSGFTPTEAYQKWLLIKCPF